MYLPGIYTNIRYILTFKSFLILCHKNIYTLDLLNVFSYFADWIAEKTNQKYPSTVIEPLKNEIIKVSDKWENDHTECKCGEVSPSARITGAYYAGTG